MQDSAAFLNIAAADSGRWNVFHKSWR